VRNSTVYWFVTTTPNPSIAIFKRINMKNQLLDPLYQTLIGFEHMLNNVTAPNTNYPPYNLYKEVVKGYVLEIAASGWTRDELEVEVTTGNTLKVTATKQSSCDREYLHRGLAHRSWSKAWTLEPDIHVSGVVFQDGLLTIYLDQKPKSTSRKIKID
jgi:molecular chaperone IbpA